MATADNLRKQRTYIESDFSHFSPRAYLEEYHIRWDEEDEFLMSFLHRAYKEITPQRTLLEIGGGPTIHQLISARTKVESIVFGEYLKKNRKEVKAWREGWPAAFDWDQYFEYVLKLEGSPRGQCIHQLKAELRKKLRFIVPCDILQPTPLPSMPIRHFDIVSVHFCPESITSDEEEFLLGLSRVINLCRKDGILVMSFLKESQMYAVGRTNFCAYPLSEAILLEALAALNCEVLELEHGPAEPERNYFGTISLVAKRGAMATLQIVR